MAWPGSHKLLPPRWDHGDDASVYLGRFGEWDLYFDRATNPLSIKTVIARDGVNGYVSGLEFVERYPALQEAYDRARDYLGSVEARLSEPPRRTILSSVPINAFNLWEGATFMHQERVYIVHHFEDFGAVEKVMAVAHRGDEPEDPYAIPFLLDYNDKVNIIGNVRNPQDFNDNDWGN